jgi:hypothetical protein
VSGELGREFVMSNDLRSTIVLLNTIFKSAKFQIAKENKQTKNAFRNQPNYTQNHENTHAKRKTSFFF